MRLLWTVLLSAATAMLFILEPEVLQAAYNNRVCLEYADGADLSCVYRKYGECRQDASAIFAAICVPNPIYRGRGGRVSHRRAAAPPYSARHAS